MRKMIQGTVLLAVIALLLACEEAAPKPVSKKPPPDERPAQLYTEIGAEELLERWSVLPGGAVSEAVANPSGRRLAAATDGFSGLPHFQFRDARKYGACVVFTVDYQSSSGPHAATLTGHIIDCVSVPAAGNPVEGLFHAAHMYDEPTGITLHVLRAGNCNPTTHVHEIFDTVEVNARIADHAESFRWIKHFEWEEADPVLVNWALLFEETRSSGCPDPGCYTEVKGGGTVGFDSLHRRDELHFQIDHSKGVVKVEPNDGAAFTEYRRRCESLGSESAIRPTPS